MSEETPVFDPVIVELIRKAWPTLLARDIIGVQPMTGPTGLIFPLRSRGFIWKKGVSYRKGVQLDGSL